MPRSSDGAILRQKALREELERRGRVSTAEFARRFGVHEITIRRDLEALAGQGMAIRCYGGAVTARRITFEFALEERRRSHAAEKRRIGAEAARRIEPGHTVLLDTGTTTLEIARALAARPVPCRVATSSLLVASALWGRPSLELLLVGGRVRRGSPDLVGPDAERMLEGIRADLAFVGSEGIDLVLGSHAEDPEAARITERMAAAARRVVCVTDRSKLGRVGPVRCLAIADLDELITDRKADPAFLAALRARGVRVAAV